MRTRSAESTSAILDYAGVAQANSVKYLAQWDHAKQIRKLSVTYHRLCEFACNGYTREKLSFESWDEYGANMAKQMEWVEKRMAHCEVNICRHATKLGLIAKFQGDPRGCVVRLYNAEDAAKDNDSINCGHGVDCWK